MVKKIRQECGCIHDDRQWLELCLKHQKEEQELHERAKQDYLEKIIQMKALGKKD